MRKIVLGLAGIAGTVAVFYAGMLVYVFHFWRPRPLSLPKEVTEVLASEAIAWVPKSAEPIQVLWRDHKRQTLKDRAALSTWLCDSALPSRTTVLFGEAEQARGLLEMGLVQLSAPPFDVPCKSTARFYAIRDKLPRESHE